MNTTVQVHRVQFKLCSMQPRAQKLEASMHVGALTKKGVTWPAATHLATRRAFLPLLQTLWLKAEAAKLHWRSYLKKTYIAL